MGRKSFVGQHGWTHGYLVTTVGHDTQVLHPHIDKRDHEITSLGPMKLW